MRHSAAELLLAILLADDQTMDEDQPSQAPVVGWRELVDLQEWNLLSVRAKADTGARSSAVDVPHLEVAAAIVETLQSLHRDGKVISNPRSDRHLQAGDRLLCFGKLEVMKNFLPERKPPRVRKVKVKPSAPGVQDS